MDRVHVIRHKHFNEGQGIRRIARGLSLSRNTVRKYLEHSEPRRREPGPRRRPVLEQVVGRIDELLANWEPRTTAKQRITGVSEPSTYCVRVQLRTASPRLQRVQR